MDLDVSSAVATRRFPSNFEEMSTGWRWSDPFLPLMNSANKLDALTRPASISLSEAVYAAINMVPEHDR